MEYRPKEEINIKQRLVDFKPFYQEETLRKIISGGYKRRADIVWIFIRHETIKGLRK